MLSCIGISSLRRKASKRRSSNNSESGAEDPQCSEPDLTASSRSFPSARAHPSSGSGASSSSSTANPRHASLSDERATRGTRASSGAFGRPGSSSSTSSSATITPSVLHASNSNTGIASPYYNADSSASTGTSTPTSASSSQPRGQGPAQRRGSDAAMRARRNGSESDYESSTSQPGTPPNSPRERGQASGSGPGETSGTTSEQLGARRVSGAGAQGQRVICQVLMPDQLDRVLEFELDANDVASRLLQLVSSKYGLVESDYFGFQYVDMRVARKQVARTATRAARAIPTCPICDLRDSSCQFFQVDGSLARTVHSSDLSPATAQAPLFTSAPTSPATSCWASRSGLPPRYWLNLRNSIGPQVAQLAGRATLLGEHPFRLEFRLKYYLHAHKFQQPITRHLAFHSLRNDLLAGAFLHHHADLHRGERERDHAHRHPLKMTGLAKLVALFVHAEQTASERELRSRPYSCASGASDFSLTPTESESGGVLSASTSHILSPGPHNSDFLLACKYLNAFGVVTKTNSISAHSAELLGLSSPSLLTVIPGAQPDAPSATNEQTLPADDSPFLPENLIESTELDLNDSVPNEVFASNSSSISAVSNASVTSAISRTSVDSSYSAHEPQIPRANSTSSQRTVQNTNSIMSSSLTLSPNLNVSGCGKSRRERALDLTDLLEHVRVEARALRGTSCESAKYQALATAFRELEDLGTQYYEVEDHDRDRRILAIGRDALRIYECEYDPEVSLGSLCDQESTSLRQVLVQGRRLLECYHLSFVTKVRVYRRIVYITVHNDHDLRVSTVHCYRARSMREADALYRSVTETYTFYRCDSVRKAVSTQMQRDSSLMGTLLSLLPRAAHQDHGRYYEFDIERTSRESYERARREIYRQQQKTIQQREQQQHSLLQGSCAFGEARNAPTRASLPSVSLAPFALSSDAPATPAKEAFAEERAILLRRVEASETALGCKVCREEERRVSVCFLPCSHACCCTQCADRILGAPISSISTSGVHSSQPPTQAPTPPPGAGVHTRSLSSSSALASVPATNSADSTDTNAVVSGSKGALCPICRQPVLKRVDFFLA